MLQWVIINTPEANKLRAQQRNGEGIKKNRMEILELKDTITKTKSLRWMGSIAEQRGQRKESVNWKTEQRNDPI